MSELPYYNKIAVVFDYYGSRHLIPAMRADLQKADRIIFSGCTSAWDNNGGIALMSFSCDYVSATSIKTGTNGTLAPIRIETQTGFRATSSAMKIYGIL